MPAGDGGAFEGKVKPGMDKSTPAGAFIHLTSAFSGW
jgi:hypothetical protein